MPEISIIVPIYKAEKYLRKCLESILKQTFTNFELLLIDDGSPDTSGSICDEYAKKDNRIKVYHKENGGVSSARNLGLENAKGKWIAFIDADDWVNQMYLEHLLEGKEYQFVVMGYKIKGEIFDETEYEVFEKDNLYKYFERYVTTQIEGCVWGALLLSDIINKNSIKFDNNLSYGEDNLFLSLYYMNISSICVLNYSDYNKVPEINSLCAIANSNQKAIHFNTYREHIEQLIYTYPTSDILKERLAKLHFNFAVNSIIHSLNTIFVKKKRRENILDSLKLLDEYKFNYSIFIEGITQKLILILYYTRNIFIIDLVLSTYWKIKKVLNK